MKNPHNTLRKLDISCYCHDGVHSPEAPVHISSVDQMLNWLPALTSLKAVGIIKSMFLQETNKHNCARGAHTGAHCTTCADVSTRILVIGLGLNSALSPSFAHNIIERYACIMLSRGCAVRRVGQQLTFFK